MEEEKEQCTEHAKITVSWGGKLLNYCPVHANQIAAVGEAMGSPVAAQMIGIHNIMQCEQMGQLTEEEKELAKTFQP